MDPVLRKDANGWITGLLMYVAIPLGCLCTMLGVVAFAGYVAYRLLN